MRTIETEFCVIAAGPAGLAAAVQAAEEGIRVVVVEKSSRTGGVANAGMGLLGIGTRYQKEQMIDLTIGKAFDLFMTYTHYMTDARLVKRYFAQSNETIEWLEGMGVEFEGAFRYFPQSEPTWHIVKTGKKIGPGAASVMNRKMTERAEKLGVTFLMETAAKKILREVRADGSAGAINGVLAETKDGEEIRILARAVLVATGGAGGNPEMMRSETGYTYGKDMFSFAFPGITGEGLRMAWKAGADHVPVRIEQSASLGGLEGLPSAVQNVFYQPNLLVNAFGMRVMNEAYMQNTTFLSNVVSGQKNRVCYCIADTSVIDDYIAHGVDVVSMVRSDPDVSGFYEGVRLAQKRGNRCPYVADTIPELAEKLGIDPETLQETVNTYNKACASADEEFFKEKRYLKKLWKPPFYACEVVPSGYGTVGGIRINENCEACGSDFLPVPGLYAAGADACNIYNDSYMFLLPGNSMGFAVNTGRIAGIEAAKYIRS